MRQRSRLLAIAVAVLLTIAACSSDDGGQVTSSGSASGGASAAGDAAIPDLDPIADLQQAPEDEVHLSYAPDVPAPITRSEQAVFDVHLEVLEGVCPLDPANDVTTEMWGYRVEGDTDVTCGSPGPVLRGRVGDLARITLSNLEGNEHPHNIDFHAVTGQGGGAADLTVAPGETATIEARLLYPGAFMYHCAYGDVPEHIAKGMYGMFIVDPETSLPDVDHEWAIMQSEWYVDPPTGGGEAAFNRESVTLEEPSYVTFNGRTDALAEENALHMKVGERARFYMVNEGLSLNSNWHPIGSHWDTVYPEAATHPDNNIIRGSQSTLVVTGGGTITEMVGQVPSTVILVDHALPRTFDKGAIGQVVIEGDENAEIFGVGEAAGTASSEGEGESASTTTAAPTSTTEAPGGGEAVATDEVTIIDGAFDPDNADEAYTPPVITVAAGTTVTWTNDDAIVHTVTSGTATETTGTPDGAFDSGDIEEGGTFSFTFDEAGEFPYYCIPHPWMQGTVIVTA